MQLVISDEHFETLAQLLNRKVKVYRYQFAQLKNARALVLTIGESMYFFTITAKELPDGYNIYALILKPFNPADLNPENTMELLNEGRLENIQLYKQHHHIIPEEGAPIDLDVESAVLIELEDSKKWMLLPEPENNQESEIISETDDILDNLRRVQLAFSRSIRDGEK